MQDQEIRRAYHERTTPPGPWRWPARHRRCGPRCWGPWTPARRPRCAAVPRGARPVPPVRRRGGPGRDRRTIPPPPRPGASSSCRNPAGAKRSWSEASAARYVKRSSEHASRPRRTAGRRSSPGADPGTAAGDVGAATRLAGPGGRSVPRCRRSSEAAPATEGAGAAEPPAPRGPGLIRVPPPSGQLSRFGPGDGSPRTRTGTGPGKLAGLVAGIDGDRAGAGGLRGDLRRGAQVPPAGLGGDRAGGRPGQPHAQALDLRGPGRARRSLLIGTGDPGGSHAARRADRGRSGRDRAEPVGVRSTGPGLGGIARESPGTRERCRSSISAWRKRNDRFTPAGSNSDGGRGADPDRLPVDGGGARTAGRPGPRGKPWDLRRHGFGSGAGSDSSLFRVDEPARKSRHPSRPDVGAGTARRPAIAAQHGALRPDLAGAGRPHGHGVRADQHRPGPASPGAGQPAGAGQPGADGAGATCSRRW